MMHSLELIRNARAAFGETALDDFGRSILEEVFSPIIMELCALEQLDEDIGREISDIDKRTEEACSLMRGMS
jgi:hypothetical protein